MCETLLHPFVIRTWLPEEPLWKPCYLSQTHFVDTGGVCAQFCSTKKGVHISRTWLLDRFVRRTSLLNCVVTGAWLPDRFVGRALVVNCFVRRI